MKIRLANKFDMPRLIDMLWHYNDMTNVINNSGTNLTVDNDKTLIKILSHIFAGGGLAIVSEQDNKLTGMLLSIINPYMWDNTKLIMIEIMYWVEPEYRKTRAGYLLLKKYIELCDEMKESGRIKNFTISKMEGQTLDYSRFGFKPIEQTWSM